MAVFLVRYHLYFPAGAPRHAQLRARRGAKTCTAAPLLFVAKETLRCPFPGDSLPSFPIRRALQVSGDSVAALIRPV